MNRVKGLDKIFSKMYTHLFFQKFFFLDFGSLKMRIFGEILTSTFWVESITSSTYYSMIQHQPPSLQDLALSAHVKGVGSMMLALIEETKKGTWRKLTGRILGHPTEEQQYNEIVRLFKEVIIPQVPYIFANKFSQLLTRALIPKLGLKRKVLVEGLLHPSVTRLSLDFVCPESTQHALANVLHRLENLEELDVHCPCGSYSNVRFPSSLQSLTLSYNGDDELLQAVAQSCPRLKRLRFESQILITATGIYSIHQLHHLQVLDISQAKVSAAHFESLMANVAGRLKELSCSHLAAAQMQGFRKLEKMHMRFVECDYPLNIGSDILQSLDLSDSVIVCSSFLKYVGHSLSHIRLCWVKEVDLWTLSQTCLVLKILELEYCEHRNYDHKRPPPNFQVLKELTIICDRSLCPWCTAQGCLKLEILCILSSWDTNELCMGKAIEENLWPELCQLISGQVECYQPRGYGFVSEEAARTLLSNCPNLEALWGVRGSNTRAALRKEYPNVQIHCWSIGR